MWDRMSVTDAGYFSKVKIVQVSYQVLFEPIGNLFIQACIECLLYVDT